ncbi:DUF559 domain-containing protein [Rhodococcus fascians]|jgi:very-short-patch-repair endonuclease|uniref:DUF559 domain-containing protein n=1 Tax=Nocardiaceae TaxID=85025 RepID=UPI00050C4505|nr:MULTISPECIES: DUF559 domain-containing protein [Rhodococcus]RZL72069.1 MAG: DUF559 domain-containing protein [Rhodococcus sp. (in: high G+C Gram-positive bacteria)]MBM7242052.1 DUF559 domain-containing protein [Rhodococcus fascians]MBY3808756.1 DUF559 domain-containing protein [Rhodococcus fascians]MBY3840200.1 DUF559 domain-containing protein [Rhodococcus fascians]MBY3845035.1 DUF559 domain-containing protein [Rhodococcus fascians]
MGVFTRQQLLDSGVSAGAIDYRARVGTLTRLLPGVYCTGEPSFRDRCVAATLWQPDAVLSHLTAAWWWNLIDDEPEQVHITVPRSTRARCPSWLRAYRRTIRETSFVDTLPVVTIEQCIVDVSASLGGAALEPFVDAALSGSVSKRGLAAQCAKSAGMAGVTEAKKQLRQCCPRTLSEPERLVARALTAAGYFLEINAAVGQYFADLLDRRARVIIEIDGREFHSAPGVFTNDRVRQNALQLEGWLVLRYSAALVMTDLDAVVRQIIETVRRRRKALS